MIDITLCKDASRIKLEGEELSLIRESFSSPNPSYSKNKFQNRFASSRIYAITPSGKADIGLYTNIISFLEKENIIYSTHPDVLKVTTPSINAPLNTDWLPSHFALRDYQSESVTKALSVGRGVIVLPTAAGKTLTIYTLIRSYLASNSSSTCFVIVPSIQLVEQTYSDFIKYGADHKSITKWSGDNAPDSSACIVIASTNILLSEKQDISSLINSNLIIIDECHKVRRGNRINDILKDTKTLHKFGFTGTLPPEKIDQWNIIGKIGPILYEKRSIDLRNVKQIAGVEIQILDIDYINKPTHLSAPNPFKPTQAYEEENEYLNTNPNRNKIISNICKTTDKNTLVMVERIAHGEILTDIVKSMCPNKQVYFIQGSIDVEVRENIRSIMETEHNVVCIAISKIFSTGISINNLHYIIFAAAGKAKIKILQSIGRGLRLHPLKNKVYIFDIADNLRYGRKHILDRIKLYEEEKIQYKRHRIQCE